MFISNDNEADKSFTTQKLVHKYGLPEVSAVFMNESGYMDDVTREKVVAVLVPSIQKCL